MKWLYSQSVDRINGIAAPAPGLVATVSRNSCTLFVEAFSISHHQHTAGICLVGGQAASIYLSKLVRLEG